MLIVIASLAVVGVAGAEIAQRGSLRISVQGGIAPKKLPRHGAAPVAVEIAGRIGTTDGKGPPQLKRIEIGINRHGRIDTRGLPRCPINRIQPSTTEDARKLCGSALVGRGTFSANVVLPEQSPFPSRGRVLAFNGTYRGKPAVLAHVYGTQPVPTSRVLAFTLRESKGTYGTVLSASLPRVASDWGFVTGLSMKLHRTYRHRGRTHSFISAGCPAPPGFPGAVFPLVRAQFSFAGVGKLESVLNRSCGARG